MKKLLVVVWAVSVSAFATEAPIEWPYPEDIPTASSAVPRPAGELPYDIVRFLKTRGPRAARISPDGKRLTFLSTVTGEPQLFRIPTQGAAPQQMTFGRAVTFYEWSPDSHWLVYGADRDGNEREAYTLIGADGRQERQLSESGPAFLAFGSFTNSGARVAFASTLSSRDDVVVRFSRHRGGQTVHADSCQWGDDGPGERICPEIGCLVGVDS